MSYDYLICRLPEGASENLVFDVEPTTPIGSLPYVKDVISSEQVLEDKSLSFIDPRYLGTIARFSDEDEQKSLQAAKCFATQFTQDEINDLIKGASTTENVVQFRRFRADQFSSESSREEL